MIGFVHDKITMHGFRLLRLLSLFLPGRGLIRLSNPPVSPADILFFKSFFFAIWLLLFLLAVRYIHPRSPSAPADLGGVVKNILPLCRSFGQRNGVAYMGAEYFALECFPVPVPKRSCSGFFPPHFVFSGISSFLHIFITQRQQDICLYTSQFAAFHPVLTGSFLSPILLRASPRP